MKFNQIWLVILLFSLCSVAMAQPGSLDPTFGNNGTVVTNIQNWNLGSPKAIVQRDSKILALHDVHGNFINGITNLLVRYTANGFLDPGFGNGGVLYMNWNSPTNAFGNACDLTLQFVGSEDKVVVGGYGYGGVTTLRVDRYNGNGSPDTSFDSDGSAFYNIGYALGVTVQPDGKLLMIGSGGELARLNFNGSLDTGFGRGGVVSTGGVLSGYEMLVQADGKIVAAGESSVGKRWTITVARFSASKPMTIPSPWVPGRPPVVVPFQIPGAPVQPGPASEEMR